MTESRVPLPDHQTFDAVRIITDGEYVGDFGCDQIEIVTVPRFKDSFLSGSEWRISVEIRFLSRGILIKTERDGTVLDASRRLLYLIKKHFILSTPQQTRAKAILFYKGVARYSFTAQRIEDVALMLPFEIQEARHQVAWNVAPPKDFCDQEGCSNRWSKVFKIKKSYCERCSKDDGVHGGIRKFCNEHSQRGKGAGFEDCDANYTDVNRIQTRSQTQDETEQSTKKRKMK